MGIKEKIKQYWEQRKVIKKNKHLLKEYPFLRMDDFGSDKILYDRTWLDLIPDGWKKIALVHFQAIKKILENNNALPYLKIIEVKEKYGRLRIYYHFPNCPIYEQNKRWLDDIDRQFDMLEKDSWNICINCGKPAKFETGGWITPICEDCKEKFNTESPNVEIKAKED